jgi:hypothetical protein
MQENDRRMVRAPIIALSALDLFDLDSLGRIEAIDIIRRH